MDKIALKRIAFYITFRCTLKCKLCIAYTPYMEQPVPHYSYEYFVKCIDSFFETVDAVDIFTFCGGETLLNDELYKMLNYASKYKHRIKKRLEIITNGTIVPSEELVLSIKHNNVSVLIDDYGKLLSKKALQVAEMLDKAQIIYELRSNNSDLSHSGGWADLTSFSCTPKNRIEAKQLYDNCTQSHELRCNPVIDGKMYVCTTCYWLKKNNKISQDSFYSYDLFSTEVDIEEKKKKLKEFINLDLLPSCFFCKGFTTETERFTPAEQLSQGGQ